MRNIAVISSLIIVLLMLSCSKDLSRSEAEKKLKTLTPEQITRFIDRRYGPGGRVFESVFNKPKFSKEYEEPLDKLQTGGWITYEKKTDSVQFYSQKMYGLWYDVKFTDKLKPFIINESQQRVKVKVADIVVDDITGITKISDTERQVEYNMKVISNALSKDLPLSEEENKSYKRQAYFRSYDDGWRIAQ